ncbi:MAG: hypothetical protein PT955_04845 [Bacteroidales bacterium]|nr:hypothetical protein [Bacteroidales bacterium]
MLILFPRHEIAESGQSDSLILATTTTHRCGKAFKQSLDIVDVSIQSIC